MKTIRAMAFCVIVFGTFSAMGAEEQSSRFPSEFQWTTGPPVARALPSGGEDWLAIKDPTIVRHEGQWHLFCTVRGRERSHGIVYLTFADWADADKAEQHLLPCHPGYFCAPQVFYFTPQKKWYMICQSSDEEWNPKYQAAYTTSDDITDPASWAKLRPLGARQADGKSGLDFWIVCDEAKAHLFFTTLDGRMWREETSLENFPNGWSEPELEIRGDIFEASHTYKLQGQDKYVTLVEAQGGHGWRYFKSYLSDRLEGPWTPLAATKETTFASMKNVRHPSSGRWTDSISHGELLRAGYDERLVVDPSNLRFLFQGVTDADRKGKGYGQIPWRLGLLELEL